MTINRVVNGESPKTHEGAQAVRISDIKTLQRSIMSCMLWEDEFYEEGEEIADRIVSLIQKLPYNKLNEVANMAIKAREEMYLRHVPLLIITSLIKRKYPVADLIYKVIQRPDELTELLSIYWKDERVPLAKQLKKGLAKAFTKFNEYSLAKYNNTAKAIKLRDVMFMVHPKPLNKEQEDLWKKLIDNKMEIPDTWETQLSAGKDKKEVWERLISEKKLGGLATLRNLRNMQEVGVTETSIRMAIFQADYSKVLPFRFIAASRYAPKYEDVIEAVMIKKISIDKKLKGKTILLVDVSGSMDTTISSKSDMTRMDAGFGLGIILREICDDLEIFTFSNHLQQIPNRHGFALRDAMNTSQPHGGTELGTAINIVNLNFDVTDRLIVITDEQSHSRVSIPKMNKAYMLNVASNQNGVGYGKWIHIDGFSEAVISYIIENESLESS